MLQNLDYSFCMVCKLWYISIRCIFKNLEFIILEVFCVCNCPPHLPSPYTKHLPFIPSIILPLPLFKRCSECLRLCLLPTFRFYSYSCWSPSIFIFYTLYTTLSLYGSYISIVFKNGSMSLQRAIYDPFLRAILIPKCTYFHL